MLRVVMLRVIMLRVVMLRVIMLRVVMLRVVMLRVVMLSEAGKREKIDDMCGPKQYRKSFGLSLFFFLFQLGLILSKLKTPFEATLWPRGTRIKIMNVIAGNTKWGSITVPSTSCLTGLDHAVSEIKAKIVSCHAADSKPVKQEVNGTVILPPLVFPGDRFREYQPLYL
jgi:hypothetical protein